MRLNAIWHKRALRAHPVARIVVVALSLLLGACVADSRDHYREFHAFGTIVSLSLYDVDSETAESAFALLENEYQTLGRDWYPWRPGELQRVNTAIADGRPIEVSEPLSKAIRLASYYETESRGRFSAGLGRLSEIWGMQPVLRPLDALPDAATVAAALLDEPIARMLAWKGNTLIAADPQIMIDLGGIAKGILLQWTADRLIQNGVQNTIINLGGDVYVIGRINGRDARIGIRSPSGDEPLAGLSVRPGEAVLTSGNYERFVEIGGSRYTHIFDPATGYPVEHSVAVTIVSRDPVQADAAATALMVGGPEEFDNLVAWMGLEYALLIGANGDTRLTPGMRERLGWKDGANPQ